MPSNAYYPRARVVLEILFRGDTETVGYDVIPRSVEVRRNTHREADTCRLELDARDFPLDPRSVAGIRVAVFLGDAGAPGADISVDDPSFRRFLGLVDEPETRLEDAAEVVRFECRDLTGLFLDYRWGGQPLDITRRLSRVVQDVIDGVPGAGKIRVDFIDGARTILSTKLGRTLWTPEPDDDAWTVLCDLCGAVGLLPVVELDTLRVLPAGRFRQRTAAFLYGRDVESLVYHRKLTTQRLQQVKVTAWDPSARTSRTATWPRSVTPRRKVSADGNTVSEPIQQFQLYVEGPYTQDDVVAIAEAAFERAARSEVEGKLRTREMRLDPPTDLDALALGLPPGQPLDLASLSNGDTLQVRLGKDNPSTTQVMSQEQAVAFLTAGPNGLPRGVALALVRSGREAEDLLSEFYVKTATHTWSRDDGYALEVEFINLVLVG